MSELHSIVVTYLVTIRTIDEDVEIPLLVVEGVVPTECELWKWRTNIGLILLVDLAIAIDILILDIAYECSVRTAIL